MQEWQLTIHEQYLLGRRIQKARKRRNMTQQEIAEALDCSIAHISALENGKTMMSGKELVFFCRMYDCSLQYFFGDILPVGTNAPEKKTGDRHNFFASYTDETLHSLGAVISMLSKLLEGEIARRAMRENR